MYAHVPSLCGYLSFPSCFGKIFYIGMIDRHALYVRVCCVCARVVVHAGGARGRVRFCVSRPFSLLPFCFTASKLTTPYLHA